MLGRRKPGFGRKGASTACALQAKQLAGTPCAPPCAMPGNEGQSRVVSGAGDEHTPIGAVELSSSLPKAAPHRVAGSAPIRSVPMTWREVDTGSLVRRSRTGTRRSIDLHHLRLVEGGGVILESVVVVGDPWTGRPEDIDDVCRRARPGSLVAGRPRPAGQHRSGANRALEHQNCFRTDAELPSDRTTCIKFVPPKLLGVGTPPP